MSVLPSPPAAHRLLTVRETAQLLGICLDSVRRQLRSGRLPGVRVGRDWRVPEGVLLTQLGLDATCSLASGIGDGEPPQSTPPKAAAVGSLTSGSSEARASASQATPEARFSRQQTYTLVEQAARCAHLSKHNMQRLLAELDDLL